MSLYHSLVATTQGSMSNSGSAEMLHMGETAKAAHMWDQETTNLQEQA